MLQIVPIKVPVQEAAIGFGAAGEPLGDVEARGHENDGERQIQVGLKRRVQQKAPVLDRVGTCDQIKINQK